MPRGRAGLTGAGRTGAPVLTGVPRTVARTGPCSGWTRQPPPTRHARHAKPASDAAVTDGLTDNLRERLGNGVQDRGHATGQRRIPRRRGNDDAVAAGMTRPRGTRRHAPPRFRRHGTEGPQTPRRGPGPHRPRCRPRDAAAGRKGALGTYPGRKLGLRSPSPGDDEGHRRERAAPAGARRRLAAAGRVVGQDGAATAATAQASAGLPQPACAGPGGDGRDLLRAAYGVPMERAEGDGPVLVVLGAPALPGVGRGRRVRGVLARTAAGLRRLERDRLGVAGAGRGDGQSAAGRGGKPDATPRIAASRV